MRSMPNNNDKGKGLMVLRPMFILGAIVIIILFIFYFNHRSEMKEKSTILIQHVQSLVDTADRYYLAHCQVLPNQRQLSTAQLAAHGYLARGAYIANPFDSSGRFLVTIENIGTDSRKFYQIHVLVTFPSLSISEIKRIQKWTKAPYQNQHRLNWFSLPSYYHTQIPTNIMNEAHEKWLALAYEAQQPQRPDFVTFLGRRGMSIVNVCPP